MKSLSITRIAIPVSLLLLFCYLILVRGTYPMVWISIETSDIPKDDYRLYLDTGRGYNERETRLERVISREDSLTLSYPLPRKHVRRIRFDPGTQTHEITIQRICLSGLLHEKCWASENLAESITPLAGIESIVVTKENLRIKTVGSDPYLDLGPQIATAHRQLSRFNAWGLLSAIFLLCVALYIWFSGLREFACVHPYPSILVVCIVLAGFCYLSAEKNFSDTAYFGGDTWEFHSMGVNWSKGQGLKFGGIEEFSAYRFDSDATDKPYYEEFIKRGNRGGTYDNLRTPGYPIFLGVIYKTFGVSPRIAKTAQLWLIAIACAALPIIGFYFWGWIGMLSGVVATPIAFVQDERAAATLMTEPLIIFTLTGFLIVFMIWKRFTNTASSMTLGVYLGLCLLVKGSMIFLPFLFIPYCVWNMRKREIIHWLRYSLFLAGFFVLVLGSWSTIASYQEGRFVLLSTQANSVLLDGNNEYSIRYGAQWRPDWRSDKNSFYRKEEIRSLPTTVKVLMFLKENIEHVPSLINDKIRIGFSLSYLFVIALFFLLESYLVLRKKIEVRSRERADLLAGVVMLLFMAFYGPLGPGHYYLYLAMGVFALRMLVIRNDVFFLPAPIVLIFLNFLFLTIVVFGDRRFTMVEDHLLILTAYAYALKVFIDLARQVELTQLPR